MLFHSVKWTAAKWYVGPQAKGLDVKIRALYVDTRLKEFTTGMPHEVTVRFRHRPLVFLSAVSIICGGGFLLPILYLEFFSP